MPKLLMRIVAVLLISCLIADPAVATFGEKAWVATDFPHALQSLSQTRFQEEAFAPVSAGFINVIGKIRVTMVQLVRPSPRGARSSLQYLVQKDLVLGVFDLTNSLSQAYEPADPRMVETLMRWNKRARRTLFGVFSGAEIQRIDDDATRQLGATFRKSLYRYAEGGGVGYAPGDEKYPIYNHPLSSELYGQAIEGVMESLLHHESSLETVGYIAPANYVVRKNSAVTVRIPKASAELRR